MAGLPQHTRARRTVCRSGVRAEGVPLEGSARRGTERVIGFFTSALGRGRAPSRAASARAPARRAAGRAPAPRNAARTRTRPRRRPATRRRRPRPARRAARRTSASQPTSGAPIGVEPRKTTEYSAITRPRMVGSTWICSAEFTPAAKVTDAAPNGISARICNSNVGAAAASSIEIPKASDDTTSSPGETRPRAPAASAPATEPDAHRRGQHRVGRRGAVPREVGQQRQQDLEVERDRPDQRHHQQRDQQFRGPAHVAQRAAQLTLLARRPAWACATRARSSSAAR